jgi:GAF domain-containing protein
MKNKDRPVAPAEGELGKPQLAALIEASKLLNATLDRDEVLRRLMTLAARGVDADRATLYLLDAARRELRSIVALGEDLHEIRLPLKEGLAGYVARSGETVNVTDAYADPRFGRRIDEETGYRTRTVLTVPMHDPQGQIGGVVQALNKRQGLFSQADERYLLALAEHAAQALENARLHASLAAENQRLSFLCHISSLMKTDTRLGDVLLTVLEGTTGILEAESSAILLWDRRRRRLVFVTVAGPKERELMEIEVPLEGSIAGWVLQNETSVIVNDVQHDPRFFGGADERTGLVTHTLIGAPLQVRDKMMGVLEVMNKRADALFDEGDLRLAQAVADHAALAIESAHRYESVLRVREQQKRQATTGVLDPLNLFRG